MMGYVGGRVRRGTVRYSEFHPAAVVRPLLTGHHYSHKIPERCSLGLFDVLNLAVAFVCP